MDSRPVPEPRPPTQVKPRFLGRYVELYGSQGHRESLDVAAIAVSKDGKTLAASAICPDPMADCGTAHFWDTTSGKMLKGTDPRGERLSSANLDDVHQTQTGLIGILNEESFDVRDGATGRTVRRFNMPTQYQCTVWTFSGDGKTLWWADERQRIFSQSIR